VNVKSKGGMGDKGDIFGNNSSASQRVIEAKVVLLGDSGVGKSSIA